MIAQWENECISLSVLSVARLMIAQWENECISLSVLFMARVMIAQWESECISLSVLSMGWVQSPVLTNCFKGFFPRGSRSANTSRADVAAWQKMAQSPLNGTTQLVDTKEGGRGPTMDRQ